MPNVPSSVARTASYALNNVLLSFIEELAEDGLAAIRRNATLRRGVYLHAGRCTHEGLSRLFGWEHVEVESLTGQ